MTKLRLTLLWSNCGPYHLSRARALAERDGLEPTIIEVNGEDEHHPWGIATGGISVPRYTLTNGHGQRPNDTILSELLEHTLEEIGQEFEVTRERIRQIEAKALRKLKHPTRARKLKTFLDE